MRKSLLITSLLLLAAPCFAADYTIDHNHSSIGFKVKHLAISRVPGVFSDFTGKFSFDAKDVASSKVEATVTAKSINTSQEKRDEHLRSSDFFDVQKFPKLSFVSKRIVVQSKDEFDMIGELTIRDVTKLVTFKVKHEGDVIDQKGQERQAFTADAKINRKDFGLTWSNILETGTIVVGDEVDIHLEIEGVKS